MHAIRETPVTYSWEIFRIETLWLTWVNKEIVIYTKSLFMAKWQNEQNNVPDKKKIPDPKKYQFKWYVTLGKSNFLCELLFLFYKRGGMVHLLLEWCKGKLNDINWNFCMWCLPHKSLSVHLNLSSLPGFQRTHGWSFWVLFALWQVVNNRVFWEVNRCFLRIAGKGKQKKNLLAA